MDRLTDILVGTVSDLSFGDWDLCSGDNCGVTVRQYREVTSHLNRHWSVNAPGVPVVDNTVSLWLSYLMWDRCCELFEVVQSLFAGILHCDNCVNFEDVGHTTLEEGVMLSSLHNVRSWMSAGFIGHSQQTMAGFVKHCGTTDMQVSRLQNPVRALPWDQLVKRCVEEVYNWCLVVLDSAGGLPVRPVIDEYRSMVCAE